MKRYVFSLHRVLRVRATQEELARQALGVAALRARQSDEDLHAAQRSYDAGLASQASLRGSVMNLLAMRDIETIRARAVVEAAQRSDDQHLAAAAAQGRWQQAKQTVSALESLDERQREQHAVAMFAEADAEADDMVSSRPRPPASTGERPR